MENKYKELLKDFACLIADTDRENFLLKHELDVTKQKLEKAEAEIEHMQESIARMIGNLSAEEVDANA